MGILNRLDKVDSVAMGTGRWKRRLQAPEHQAGLTVWSQLSEAERDMARDAAVWAWTVEGQMGLVLPALAPLLMLPVIGSVQLRRSDRARQQNLRTAARAGRT